jgi:hypothetical protein
VRGAPHLVQRLDPNDRRAVHATPLHLLVAPVDRRARRTSLARNRKQPPLELGVDEACFEDNGGAGLAQRLDVKSLAVDSQDRVATGRRVRSRENEPDRQHAGGARRGNAVRMSRRANDFNSRG